MNYYLGKWKWIVDDVMPGGYWRPPDEAVGALDLRPLPAQGQKEIANGVGFFITEKPIYNDEYLLLGTDINDIIPAKGKRKWEEEFGYTPIGSVKDVLMDLMTDKSDPTGLTAPKPLDGRNKVQIVINGRLIAEKPFLRTGTHWEKIKQLRKLEFIETKNLALEGKVKLDLHKMLLYNWQRKYGVNYTEFLPKGSKDKPMLPQTVLTESFNKADSTILGPDQSWSEFVNWSSSDAWKVLNNQCVSNAGQTLAARAEAAVSSANHYVEVYVMGLGSGTQNIQLGAMGRYSSSAQTAYIGRVLQILDRIYFTKVVNKTMTDSAYTDCTIDTGVPIRITIEDDKITITYNGTTLGPTTDTAISGGTRGGIFGYTSGVAGVFADDWKMGDLVVPSVGRSLGFIF